MVSWRSNEHGVDGELGEPEGYPFRRLFQIPGDLDPATMVGQ
jgi:hypothetical protein